jgi:RimJ/RimL family protein N-acetyltransferase
MCVIEKSPVLETRRLVLRSPEVRDAGRIAELADDFDIARMTLRMPHPYARRDADEFVRRVMAQDPQRGATFLIEHEDEGPVGVIGLFYDADPFPEMGYWIGRPFWGRGFATEACDGVLDWVKHRWGKRAVMAGHFTDNPASGRVLTKAGFLYTGEVRTRPSLARGADTDTRMMVWLA